MASEIDDPDWLFLVDPSILVADRVTIPEFRA
jgi:hypothetical protein